MHGLPTHLVQGSNAGNLVGTLAFEYDKNDNKRKSKLRIVCISFLKGILEYILILQDISGMVQFCFRR